MSNKVLAVVNGKEITEDLMKFTMTKFPQDRQAQFSTENGKKDLLDQIVSWELVYNYAKEQGLEKNEEYLFQLEEAKKAILGQLVMQQTLGDIDVTDKEAEDYYNKNTEYFVEPEQVSARHILVDSEEKATSIKKEISNGMAFDEAARKYSSCPSSEQGGSLGTFGKGMMVPEFEKVAFSSSIGEVTDPVKTQFGYHLILVDQKIEGSTKTFIQVKDMIKGHLIQEKQNHKYMELINVLKGKYTVEYK